MEDAAQLSSSVHIQVVETFYRRCFFEDKNQWFYNGLFTCRETFTTDFGGHGCPKLGHLSSLWTSTTTRFLQATLLSTSTPYPWFCLGFGKTFTPRIPTWSSGVGGALCSNRLKSDLYCFFAWTKISQAKSWNHVCARTEPWPKSKVFLSCFQPLWTPNCVGAWLRLLTADLQFKRAGSFGQCLGFFFIGWSNDKILQFWVITPLMPFYLL